MFNTLKRKLFFDGSMLHCNHNIHSMFAALFCCYVLCAIVRIQY